MSKVQEWKALCEQHGFKSNLSDEQEIKIEGYIPSKSLSVSEAKQRLIESVGK